MSAAAIAAALTGKQSKPMPGGNFLVRCPAHDDRHPSLSIRDGENGLIVHCWSGCEARDVYAALRQRGLISENTHRPKRARPAPVAGISHERRQHEKAGWLWHHRRPITDSIAEVYLREARGYTGLLPPTLGFLPPTKPEHHPALIAAFAIPSEPEPSGVLDVPRDVDAVHLTLLQRDGSGKADVKPNKLTLGRPLGRPIVLAPVNDLLGLAITEGIEDGLSAFAATGLGVWAAGSASFLPALADRVLGYVTAVTIFSHPDPAGQRGTYALAKRLDHRGIEVLIEGCER
jgi:Toprim domain